jgi:uncharacterized protein (TIGR00730 family)
MATNEQRRVIRRVCVYCASSRQSDPAYLDAARRLGALWAAHDVTVVYGGGSVGSMGALADGALDAGGQVVGVLPRFMFDLEWGHRGLTELRLVDNLHERKRLMVDEVDAIVALPGGSGTLEELLEAISWKRLGLHAHPIVVVNLGGFFAPLIAQLELSIRERFMSERHRDIWSIVASVEDVLPAIRDAPPWDPNARAFATV